MKTFRLPLFLWLGATLLAAAESPADSDAEKIIKLDPLFVSAGPDAKSAFDLAQGTSTLVGEELRRRQQATLGETLAGLPGVNSTYYGPAASRPIIRGMGGDRVRVLTNSIGALDASNISPDHATAIEPLFASRIEVLRGPATLLYGSSAVGGVVNVVDNRIPDDPAGGRPRGVFEVRGFGPADERAGVLSSGAGNETLTLQLNCLRRQTGDVRIPGVARVDAEAPVDQAAGRLASSALDTISASIGAAHFWSGGKLGGAVSRYETDYGVPTGDEPALSIRLRQTRLDLTGETTESVGAFRVVRVKFGLGDYRHRELTGGTVVNTAFRNRAWEGRLEASLEPMGDFDGTIGLQAQHSDFAAVGDEVVTPPFRADNLAVFLLEELKRGPVTWQVGGRYEFQRIALGEVAAGLPAVPGFSATTGQRVTAGGPSLSGGLVYYPAKGYSVGVTVAYTERLPTAQERFSNGPHGGTRAYEVGTGGLANEKSVGLDLVLRRRSTFMTGALSLFLNRFNGYIFEQELPAGAIPAERNHDGLTPYQFVAKDALFTGGEAEMEIHLWEKGARHLHVEVTADYVRALQTIDDEPLPRIPPLRYGARLHYEDSRWDAGVEVRHTTRQNRVGAGESPTDGHTLLGANLSYLVKAGIKEWELFLRGTNLTNITARSSTSFLKEFAPLPGRGVVAGVRLVF